jgi:protein O-mannosyl-transferase
VGLLLALLTTVAIYWPCTSGTFVFDDYPNIVDNRDVHMTTLDGQSLLGAALSSPSPTLVRPLAMVSFALDWYFSNGSSRFMKLENILIHLANGVVLFFLVTTLLRLSRTTTSTGTKPTDSYIAFAVTTAWLLSPINFTAVAYVVQRMESLCNFFVFGGLFVYLRLREEMVVRPRLIVPAAATLVFATALGCCVKESAALLPLYAFVADCCLTGLCARDRKIRSILIAMYSVVLFVPASVAAAWSIVHFSSSEFWVSRNFTLTDRLLTEPRIILDYVRWSLIPRPNDLSLYHDNIVVSRDVLHPITTILSIVTLFCAFAAAIWMRQRQPRIAVGILWFLCAHLLTATIIPLELVFEHRNYFASVGLYLILFTLMFERASHMFVRKFAASAILVLFASITALRAAEWSNPLSFAISEAAKNPESPRTAYELGRTYVVMSRYDPQSPFVPLSFNILQKASSMKDADALPDQAILILSANLHQQPPADTWKRLRAKLVNQPLSTENVFAIYALVTCSINKICKFPPVEMIETLSATIESHNADTRIITMYANYAANVLADFPFAIELGKEAALKNPSDIQLRANVLILLKVAHRTDEAIDYYNKTVADLPAARNNKNIRALALSIGANQKP